MQSHETTPAGRTRRPPGFRGIGRAGGILRVLGRLGYPAAAAALIALAVVVAEGAQCAIAAIRGVPFGAAAALDAGALALIVATPIVILAQLVIRQLGASRQALRQLTERLALAVDSAEQANIAKSQFLANTSHELRTPLNAIIGFSELIQAQTFGPLGHERYLEYVKDIARSGHHLLRIINEILDLAKIEAGGVDTREEEVFNLAAVVEATLRMIRPLAERQGVSIESAGSADEVRLIAVERMVCQILLNLLSNAVKFTPAGGHIRVVTTRSIDGGLMVAVSDTGMGMTPHEIAVALIPFGQVDSPMSRKQIGTGLGLPLAKAMMELHGGALKVTSAPARGTTVSLSFPAARVVSRDTPQARDGGAGESAARREAGAKRVA